MSGSSKKPTVLISGSSTGIGEATATFLADKGWTVFAGVRKQSDGETLKSHSRNIHLVILDVTKEAQVKEAVEQVRVAVGEDGLDALINNAGIVFCGPTEFISMEDVQRQFDVNVFGLLRLTQAAMPLIRMGKPGRVINISSTGAQQVSPLLGVYNGTKAAMEVMTQAFRQEVSRWGIKVVMIRPGPVKSSFQATSSASYRETMKTVTPGTSYHTLFGRDLENMSKAAEVYTKNAVEPIVVAEVIHEALTVMDPKLMYYDTFGSWFGVQLISWMPSSWYDAIVQRIFLAKD